MTAPDLFAHDSILADAPTDDRGEQLEILHDREYRVRAYRKGDDVVLIRGAVRDQKPPGLYFADDPSPLTIHHMQLDIEVRYPTMEIVSVDVAFETHPNNECPNITRHYDELIGLSVARGFTHKVRELFGGPRGCTHTTALLQAMAPVAVQCIWSLHASNARRRDRTGAEPPASTGDRSELWKMNVNTCHVWAEDSEVLASVKAGEDIGPPLFASERMVTLGLKPEDWRKQMG